MSCPSIPLPDLPRLALEFCCTCQHVWISDLHITPAQSACPRCLHTREPTASHLYYLNRPCLWIPAIVEWVCWNCEIANQCTSPACALCGYRRESGGCVLRRVWPATYPKERLERWMQRKVDWEKLSEIRFVDD